MHCDELQPCHTMHRQPVEARGDDKVACLRRFRPASAAPPRLGSCAAAAALAAGSWGPTAAKSHAPMTTSADCDPIYLSSMSMHGGSLAGKCTSAFPAKTCLTTQDNVLRENELWERLCRWDEYRDERLLKPDLGVQRFGNSLEEFASLQPWRAVHEDIGPQLAVLVQ